jgi:hypothetical protein
MQQQKNFSWLLLALLGYLVVAPIAEDMGVISARLMRVLVFTWLFVFGVWSLRGFGRFFHVGISFTLVGIALSVIAAQTTTVGYFYASFAALYGFMLIVIWCTGKQVVLGKDISANRVVGAISLYLLLGAIWAISYAVLEMLAPGSFTGFSAPISQGWSSEWLYFSFVTMTTLGYGDLAPLSSTARTLAYMQAVFGQFYIAILVAGLVSGYITHNQRA